jgi:SAM-dependent methyltransferase
MKTYEYEGVQWPIEHFVQAIEQSKTILSAKGGRPHKTLRMIDPAEGDKVLDVGCNYGPWSFFLHERGFDVTGVDLFQNQIDIAIALKASLKIDSDRLRFRQMDFLDSDLPDNHFDDALFLETIEHVKNPTGFLDEFMRVLRPGGYLIVSTPNVLNTYYILKQLYPKYSKLFKMIDNEKEDTGTHLDHIYAWDIFSFYRLLHRSGFRYVKHEFAGFEVPFLMTVPFHIPVLSRFSRSMIFKVQKPF